MIKKKNVAKIPVALGVTGCFEKACNNSRLKERANILQSVQETTMTVSAFFFCRVTYRPNVWVRCDLPPPTGSE